MKDNIERLVGSDTNELLRLRFERLRTVDIAKKVIQEKASFRHVDLTDELLDRKARGLSSAIDSALSYLQIGSSNLNARVLSRYYALLQLTIAEVVSSPENASDLSEVQKHTEQGHGLNTFSGTLGTDFLDNYSCYVRTSGHFQQYLRFLEIQGIGDFSFERKLESKNANMFPIPNVASLSDLFRRIPELNNALEEYVGKVPLSLSIGIDMLKEGEKKEVRREIYSKDTSTFQFSPPPDNSPVVTTSLTIYKTSPSIDLVYLNSLGLPFQNLVESTSTTGDELVYDCEFTHPNEGHWWRHIQTYKSDYSPSCYIVPLFGKINDPIAINYMLMYALSIIVRYLPDVWYEITQGRLQAVGSLIDYYLTIFDHTIPHKMLERITGKQILLTTPGTFFAPF